jgi:tetratricopeptide (TPR) repeat protein
LFQSKGVYTESEQLINQLKEDQRLLERIDATSVGISIYSRNGSTKLEHRNALFMYLQIFIEIIIKMRRSPEKGRKDLLDLLKDTYEDNDVQLSIISEFEHEYVPEKAIWWYTRETCFYRLLNKALRAHDFGLLLQFRFFITDLYNQLVVEHENYLQRLPSDNNSVLNVYRGQAIHVDELNTIRESVGEFISMDSFLSTATDKTTALGFTKQVTVTEDTQRILFDFDIDTRSNSSKPFANIRHLSYYEEEDEVLIMLGSIFQIKDVEFSQKQNMWIAKLVLCSDDDYALKDIFAYEKNLLGADPGLVSLGRMLGDMGNYEQATSVLTQALIESRGDFEAQDCYLMLGAVARLQDDYDTSLTNYLNCLEIQLKIYSPDHPHTAQTYSEIADLYWRKKEYDLSLEYSQKAFDILPIQHKHRANVYRTMGNVHRDKAMFDLALGYYKKALDIQKRTLPKDHNHIGRTYNQIGVVYELQHDYPVALQCYNDALRILKKTLPPTHEEVERAENHIRDVKDKMK